MSKTKSVVRTNPEVEATEKQTGASLIPGFSVSKRIELARNSVKEMADNNERACCLAVAASDAIFDPDKERTAIKLLEVLEELLSSTVNVSSILKYLPEEADHGK